jgi:GLPGLI family protein
MRFNKFHVVFLLLILVTGYGCNPFTTDNISEGVIQYEITYPVSTSDNVMASLMPTEMKYQFKNHNSAAELSAGMGMFSTSFISNAASKTLTQLVKIMNKRYALVSNNKEVDELIQEQPKIQITFTKDTKVIAGYKCKKAIVTLPETKQKFDVFYTKDIDIKNPNWSSPFREIDGVLMEYQIKRYNVEMRFTAKSVTDTKVEDAIFELPGDYKKISKKEMDEMFANI